MTKGFLKFVAAIWTVMALCMGCSHVSNDARLARIAAMIDTEPKQAMAALDSIDGGALGDVDRHYYDFLTVKARDKAYVTHTSDSLIRSIIDYYSEHGGEQPPYAEVLYYGGRVYSDLGDLPTALTYFRQAVDAMDGTTLPYRLRCNILSQTGRLLSDMRLYDEAVPYIRRALKIERAYNDSLKMVYDLQLLGTLHTFSGNYAEAERCFIQALKLSAPLPPKFMAKSLTELAVIKSKTGDIDGAVQLIQDVPERTDSLYMTTALGHASRIYYQAGMYDSAYATAIRVIENPISINKFMGYGVLLKPEMRRYIPKDSLNKYMSIYIDYIENRFDENGTLMSINQQSKYNYSRHEMARIRAEQSKDHLQKWLMLLGFVMLIFVIAFLLYKNHNQRNIIKLKTALANLEKLKLPQPLSHDITNISPSHIGTGIRPYMHDDVKGLREQLKQKICSLLDNNNGLTETSPVILHSDAYRELRMLIWQKTPIKDPKLWDDLEVTIHKVSPNFKSNLILLTNGKLTDSEYHTAMIIKCGMTPTELAVLMGRAKGTISKRREGMCLKLLDEQLGATAVDNIIRML